MTSAPFRASAIIGLFARLWSAAQQSGTDQRADLRSGSRITVRVDGDVTVLTIARRNVQVGASEEKTFRRDCGVPEGATRIPAVGQYQREDGGTWNVITFAWNHETKEAADVPRKKRPTHR